MMTGRLHWFDHVKGKSENDWVKHDKYFEVEGIAQVGRPKKTWEEALWRHLEIKEHGR